MTAEDELSGLAFHEEVKVDEKADTTMFGEALERMLMEAEDARSLLYEKELEASEKCDKVIFYILATAGLFLSKCYTIFKRN